MILTNNQLAISRISLINDINGGYFSLSAGESVYLLPGPYSTYVRNSPYNMITLPLNVDSDISLKQLFNLKKVVVRLTEDNSRPLSGVQLSTFNGSTYGQAVFTDVNGEAEFLVQPGYYEFRQGQSSLGDANITDNQTVTINLPKEITFKVFLKGKPFNGHITATDDKGFSYVGIISDGVAKMRIPDKLECFVTIGNSPYPSKISISSGCSLNFLSVKVLADGNGLAFPLCNYYREMPEQLMLENDNLHLVAVPAAKSKFYKWVINNIEFENDVIDYQISENIIAIAKFSQDYDGIEEVISDANSYDGIRIQNGCIYFPQKINGKAILYSVNGMILKSENVNSDYIDTRFLGHGVYLLELYTGGNRYVNKLAL